MVITDFYPLLALLAAYQGLLFGGFLLAVPRQGGLSRRLLGIFLCLIGLHFLNLFLLDAGLVLINLGGCFAVFYAPLLYGYVRTIVDPGWRPGGSAWLHASPVLVCIAWTVHDIHIKFNGGVPNSWLTPPILIQMVIYLLLTWRHFRRYSEIVVQSQSSIGFSRRRMLQFFLTLYLVLMVGVGVEYVMALLREPVLQTIAIYVVFASVLVLVSGLALMGLSQPLVFQAFAPEDVSVVQDKQDKYRTSSLTEDDADRYLKQLEAVMIERQPHLDPGLTLADLADAADVPARYLSQVINQRLGLTFFDFINKHRIEAVQQAMAEDPAGERTVLDLMYDAGFQSKSSFNKAFKKHVGATPSAYRDSLSKSS